ncbi:hypothetical protein B0H17DRAFT_345564 [Mycena rosella]|uniref:Uncharacterized protein n=1 Tax=Mycena rosella TaxID=1033263 RepID=A0AAD7G292_MYCRO|nr:hypothetical protein B0H17DRAFT_345564 [Mycena rosella]
MAATHCSECGADVPGFSPENARDSNTAPESMPVARHQELMGSNVPPQDAEFVFIRGVISKTDARLSHLDDRISRLRTQLAELENERAAAVKYRLQNKAILSPLRRKYPRPRRRAGSSSPSQSVCRALRVPSAKALSSRARTCSPRSRQDSAEIPFHYCAAILAQYSQQDWDATYKAVSSLISKLAVPNPTGSAVLAPQLSEISFGCLDESYSNITCTSGCFVLGGTRSIAPSRLLHYS